MPWFYVQLLHATRCNNRGHSDVLQCLQLLQRVARENCTQQLHMRPRHNTMWTLDGRTVSDGGG